MSSTSLYNLDIKQSAYFVALEHCVASLCPKWGLCLVILWKRIVALKFATLDSQELTAEWLVQNLSVCSDTGTTRTSEVYSSIVVIIVGYRVTYIHLFFPHVARDSWSSLNLAVPLPEGWLESETDSSDQQLQDLQDIEHYCAEMSLQVSVYQHLNESMPVNCFSCFRISVTVERDFISIMAQL